MRTNHCWRLLALGCWALLVLPVKAQIYSVLYSFTNSPDGASPYAGLILSSNVLYGTTSSGGSSGAGTVFQINTDGTGFTVLRSFTNSPDGANPAASLTLSGNVLYGTTKQGGRAGYGTVFKVNKDGTGYTVLNNFLNSGGGDGANPVASLTLSSNVFYGTAGSGGTMGYGAVFKVNTDGTGFTVLQNFSASGLNYGTDPVASLTLSGNVLYGTTSLGGINGYGAVFKVNTDGTACTVLRSFANTPDGASSYAGLILSSNVLYGTTSSGGISGAGTVFQINTDGTGFTVLRSFTNSPDGANPAANLTMSGNVLYGTTKQGGRAGYGTVFNIYVGPYPIVVSQPQNQIASVSNTASFSVTAGGTFPFGYQWYFTNTTFQTAGAYAQTLSGFVYGCLVTNGGWGYTTVPQVQFIGGGGTGAAGYATVSNGLVTAITVTNTGSDYTSLPLVQIDPPKILLFNQTNATMNLSAVTTNNLGGYFVVITNAYGSVTSSVASLNLSPSIVNQPQSLAVWAGSIVSFAVTGDNTGPFSYQWKFNGTNIAGATNTSFTVNPVATNNAGAYTVTVSNIYGGIISSGAVLTVNLISQQPVNQAVTNGGTAVFEVLASGTGTLTYQWRFNGTNLPSATQATLTLNNVATNNVGNYAVVISAVSGSVTSSVVALNLL